MNDTTSEGKTVNLKLIPLERQANILRYEAQEKCTKCYGRGYRGKTSVNGEKIYIICRCISKHYSNTNECIKSLLMEDV